MVSSSTFALAFVQLFIILTTVSLTTFVTAMDSFGSSDSTGLPNASQAHAWAPQLKESWFHANRVSQRQATSDEGNGNVLKAFYEAKAQHDQLMGSRNGARAASSSSEHSREKVAYDRTLQSLQEWELVDDESTTEKALTSAGKVPRAKKTSSSSRRKKAMEKQMQRMRRIDEDDEEAAA